VLAVVGLLYVSLTYTSVFSLAEQPDLIRSLYARDPSGWVWTPPTLGSGFRWLHMVLGALTVGGFFVGWLGQDRPAVLATGRAFLLWGMLGSALAGTGYLITLRPVLRAFMHTPAIWALTAGILLSAGSLHFFLKRKFLVAGSFIFASMFTMVYARHTVRVLLLTGQFDPGSWRIAPQWSVLKPLYGAGRARLPAQTVRRREPPGLIRSRPVKRTPNLKNESSRPDLDPVAPPSTCGRAESGPSPAIHQAPATAGPGLRTDNPNALVVSRIRIIFSRYGVLDGFEIYVIE
jgi:hypothetical protein